MGVAPVTCGAGGCGIQGFLIGFAVIVVLTVAFAFLLGSSMTEGIGILIPVGISITFIVLVGWWPIWTVIFIGLFIVFIIFNPFGRSASGGV